MSSDGENEGKEAKPSKSSGEKKKSMRKRLGLPKKSKGSRSKSGAKSDRSNSDKNLPVDNSSSKSLTVEDESLKGLNEVNDSIANDAAAASLSSAASIATNNEGESTKERIARDARRIGKGVMKRVRSLSRSRSSRRRDYEGDTDSTDSSESGSRRPKSTVVTVTSCRSDGYYNQKAPGSTSKLPRKAPTNLKNFHELAVGLKDAFAAVGQTPTKPELTQEVTDEATGETKIVAAMSEEEFNGRTILWDFMGNIDFVRKIGSEIDQEQCFDELFESLLTQLCCAVSCFSTLVARFGR